MRTRPELTYEKESVRLAIGYYICLDMNMSTPMVPSIKIVGGAGGRFLGEFRLVVRLIVAAIVIVDLLMKVSSVVYSAGEVSISKCTSVQE